MNHPRRSPLIDAALRMCPAEFRAYFADDIHADAADSGNTLGVAANVLCKGLALHAESILRDIGFALRMLRKTPLFTLVAITTLALALSVNTAVFGVIDSVLLKALPFVQPDRLAFICSDDAGPSSCNKQTPSTLLTRIGSPSNLVDGIAQFQRIPATLTGKGIPRSSLAVWASTNFFDVLRVRPEVGRFFTSADGANGARSVIISDRLWRSLFERDAAIIGRPIVINGQTQRIVGVIPPSFVMPIPGDTTLQPEHTDVIMPMPATVLQLGVNNWSILRLRQGASTLAVQSDIQRITAQASQRDPRLKGIALRARALSDWYLNSNNTRTVLFLAFAAVFAVLLIACANIANLLMARGATRQGELAIRTALGASRGRVVRHMLTEIILIAAGGGVIGLALADMELHVLVALNPQIVPRVQNVHIDTSVVIFTVIAVVVVTLLSGIIPAMLASRPNVVDVLKAASRSRGSSRRGDGRAVLAVAEIALAFTVVVASGLLVRSALIATHAELGLNPANVYWSAAALYTGRYVQPGARVEFAQQVLERVRAIPSVESVAVERLAPYFGNGSDGGAFRIPGKPFNPRNPSVVGNYSEITPDHFHVLQIPLIGGRAFTDADRAGSSPVAIVDANFARIYFAGANPLGKHLLLQNATGAWIMTTIVGEAGTLTQEPWLYVPFAQHPPNIAEIVVRTRIHDTNLLSEIASAVASIDPSMGIFLSASMEERIAQSSAPQRTSATLLAILAAVALFLALAGIYAIVTYSVEGRTHEFGIRRAIGARASDIFQRVLRAAAAYAIIGIFIGLPLAAWSATTLSELLVKTSPFDPTTFLVVIVLLCASTASAASIPAMRAVRIAPVEALRYE